MTISIPNASAATPACGRNCITFVSRAYGSASPPSFVLANVPAAETFGQSLTLARASSSKPGEDYTLSIEGKVSDFIAAGLMASGMAIYGSLEALEIDYTPDGLNSGLCIGTFSTPGNGTRVGLASCGVSARTVWIADTPVASNSYEPWINGATASNFADPYVLTTLSPGFPATTSQLHTSSGGVIAANQMWQLVRGVLPRTAPRAAPATPVPGQLASRTDGRRLTIGSATLTPRHAGGGPFLAWKWE